MTEKPERQITCPCGVRFASRDLTRRYCSDQCRKRLGRYGKTHGQVAPRELSVWGKRER